MLLTTESLFMFKYLLFASLLALAACGPSYVFEETHDIPAYGWTYKDTITYSFEISDTSILYDLTLRMKHTPEFGSQNFYTRIYTGFPSGKRISKVLSLELADKNGLWAGDCGSKSCTLDIPIQTNVYFNQPGIYTLSFEQFMRQDSIQGIQSLGLKLGKAEESGNK